MQWEADPLTMIRNLVLSMPTQPGPVGREVVLHRWQGRRSTSWGCEQRLSHRKGHVGNKFMVGTLYIWHRQSPVVRKWSGTGKWKKDGNQYWGIARLRGAGILRGFLRWQGKSGEKSPYRPHHGYLGLRSRNEKGGERHHLCLYWQIVVETHVYKPGTLLGTRNTL